MSEYSIPLVEIVQWTVPQLMLFAEKITDRKEREFKQQAKLHGAEVKSKGLDIDDAVPIEEVIANGQLTF